MSMEGVQLRFTKDAVAAIARKAIAMKTGARALRSILEAIMLDITYSLPDVKEPAEVLINQSVVEGRSKAKIRVKSDPPDKLDAA